MRWVIAATVVLGGWSAVAHATRASDRTLVTPRPVTQLAAAAASEQGLHVAFSSGCTSVSVWRLVGGLQTLRRSDCQPPIYALSLTSDAAVWATRARRTDGALVYGLWESHSGSSGKRLIGSRSGPYGRPVRLHRSVAHPDATAPLVIGDGAYWLDGAIHYTGFPPRVDPGFPVAPRRLVVSDAYLAVLTADGAIETYLENTRQDPPLARIDPAAPVMALKIERELLILQMGQLEVYTERGERIRTLPLPQAKSYGDDRCFAPRCTFAELRLADFEWPYAVYVHGPAVHLLNVKTGRDLVVRRAAPPPVHAQMEATGLIYSAGNRITYVPRREIDKLFR